MPGVGKQKQVSDVSARMICSTRKKSTVLVWLPEGVLRHGELGTEYRDGKRRAEQGAEDEREL